MANGEVWPPDYGKVLSRRLEELHSWRADPDKLRRVKAYYKTHPVDFIRHWCDTYDPRAAMHGGRSRMP